jgi:hypothetical protein
LAAGWVLAAVAGAAMVLRRRLPAVATVVAGAATVVGSSLGVCADPLLAVAWCLYPLAVAGARRIRVPVLIGAGLLTALAAVTAVPVTGAGRFGPRWLVAVCVVSVVQLEVAREVHDVVGHALGLIGAEAGVTRGLPDVGEQELRGSLADIERYAREALEEVQALVRGLRLPAGRDDGPAIASMARLSTLVDSVRAAGVDVDARILIGEPGDGAVGAVVFRTVQEALSNVVRHAPGAACAVQVCREGDTILVQVRDHGPGACPDGRSGFGLIGLTERVRSVGGTVRWGRHPAGGFEVTARLPVRGGAR